MSGAVKPVSAHVMEGASRFGEAVAQSDLFISDRDRETWHRLEYFPTPPWAVRAMIETLSVTSDHSVGGQGKAIGWVLEPACGRGHIMEPLREAGCRVEGMDIHDHGIGARVGDFLGADFACDQFDAVITNPPFKLAADFVRRGLEISRHVIVLCRLSFLASASRYDLHFNNPAGNLCGFMPCLERVPMVLGRYDPKASTATEFAWYHYRRGYRGVPVVRPIPPGSRERFQRREDVRIGEVRSGLVMALAEPVQSDGVCPDQIPPSGQPEMAAGFPPDPRGDLGEGGAA